MSHKMEMRDGTSHSLSESSFSGSPGKAEKSTESIKMAENRIRQLPNLNLCTNFIGRLPESQAHINSSRLFPTTFIPGVPGSDLGINEISFSSNKSSRRVSN